MAIMPGASRALKFTGNRHKATIDKIILHTTEGGSLPNYQNGAVAPHFTVHRDGRIWQHIDTAQSSKALQNRAGGVETNNDGAVQIEYIGSCDKSYAKKFGLFFVPNATDEDLAGLASVLAWIHKTHGVPLTDRGLTWSDSNAAYLTAPQRMSQAKWRSFSGVCGHQHVPENVHWDPGKLPVSRLLALAGGASSGAGAGASKPAAPAVKKNGDLVADGRFGTATVKKLQTWLNEKHGAKLTVDGKAGTATWKALQKALGAPYVDGEISRQSYKASELGNGITQGWGYTGRGSKGSQTVKLLQKLVGATADGVWGEGTTKALQVYLNKNA